MEPMESCWPTPSHLLFLKAALFDEKKAKAAWETICKTYDLHSLDYPSTSLLPLIFHNLSREGLSETASLELKIPKSVYRHTWSRNHLLLFGLEKVLKKLQEADVATCLLEGASMTPYFWGDPGLCSMSHIDLLISKEALFKVLHLLGELGYSSKISGEENLKKVLERLSAIMLFDPEGNKLNLHWAIFQDSGIDALKARYSYRTIPSSFARILSPEDQLVYTLLAGLSFRSASPFRWIADATMILRKTEDLDWNYFLSQAKALELEWMLYSGLRYLSDHQFYKLPKELIEKTGSYVPGPRELRHYHFITQKPRKLLSIFQSYWHAHVRSSRSENIFFLLWSLPDFLKKALHLKRMDQILFRLLRVCYTHLRN